MASTDGRLIVVFSGEIYNFREPRRELETSGTRLHTKSNTGVLLPLTAEDGERMLRRLRGELGIPARATAVLYSSKLTKQKRPAI